MSLAWRIVLLALLLNVLTVGSVQVVVHLAQANWYRDELTQLDEAVREPFAQIERLYSAKTIGNAPADAAVVRRLLSDRSVREQYDDVIVTNGRPPYEGVYLNPLGAVGRDPDRFQNELIVSAIVQAREVDGLLQVAGGYCRALRLDGDIVGYIWFVPKFRPTLPTSLPLWTSALGVLASTVLFGSVLFWVMRHTVRRPLAALGDAAAAVAAGRYDVQLPAQAGLAELGPVVATFNHMAAQVANHTGTLERAVQEAVEQAKQKERALVQSSRLASIGTLAAGLAHEINNPIGGMQNAVHRLLQNPDLAERQRVYLELVQDGLQRVGRTARRLLDFAPGRRASGQFHLQKAVDGARALVEHRLQRRGVVLGVDLPPELPPILGDAHEIQQVMLNLFLNSLDAIEEKGGGRIDVRAHAEAGRLHLFVDDDGPGMAPEDLPRIFDPFFTKKERPDASGLGMFISYSIVQSHGGELRVTSSPGQGFHVHITLPAAPAA
ncbi:MAG: HAMP domain-containing histidine kinase [Planctomycetes bacterium]|nr:HAMP domain-containing histidine kinase [Planctomycetota bacterium]